MVKYFTSQSSCSRRERTGSPTVILCSPGIELLEDYGSGRCGYFFLSEHDSDNVVVFPADFATGNLDNLRMFYCVFFMLLTYRSR